MSHQGGHQGWEQQRDDSKGYADERRTKGNRREQRQDRGTGTQHKAKRQKGGHQAKARGTLGDHKAGGRGDIEEGEEEGGGTAGGGNEGGERGQCRR